MNILEMGEIIPLTERREGLIIGAEIELEFGENIGIELNVEESMDYYKNILIDSAKSNPRHSKVFKQHLNYVSLERTMNRAIQLGMSYLEQIANLMDDKLIENQPTSYEEEIKIVQEVYANYVGAPLEEIVGKELFIDVLGKIPNKI